MFVMSLYINEYAIRIYAEQRVSNSESWTGYIFTYSKYITYMKAHKIEGSFIIKDLCNSFL